MPDRVTIPAALAAEIAADLEAGRPRADRVRPQIKDGVAEVLILASDNPHAVGLTAGSMESDEPWPWPRLGVDVDGIGPEWANAWAPVGGVDGGPRPGIGDRVLVLTDAAGDCPEPWIGHVTYAAWGNLPIGAVMADGRTHLAAQESAVTQWALLPPEIPMYELAIHIPMTTFTSPPNDDPRIDQFIDRAMDLFPDADITGGIRKEHDA